MVIYILRVFTLRQINYLITIVLDIDGTNSLLYEFSVCYNDLLTSRTYKAIVWLWMSGDLKAKNNFNLYTIYNTESFEMLLIFLQVLN